MGTKHCEKRRKCWLPAFSPFPTMFSKASFFRAVKKSGLCGKVLNLTLSVPIIMSERFCVQEKKKLNFFNFMIAVAQNILTKAKIHIRDKIVFLVQSDLDLY